MSIALDTNVIIALVAGTDREAHLAAAAIDQAGRRGALHVSPLVYAELFAHPGWSQSEIDDFLGRAAIDVLWRLPRTVWPLAGTAFAQYAQRRRRSPAGQPRRLLANFLIGAHALCEGAALLTSDAAFYRRAFPSLTLISPGGAA